MKLKKLAFFFGFLLKILKKYHFSFIFRHYPA